MPRYRYSGPLSGVTLADGTPGGREVMLIDGQPVDLPADHSYVQGLVDRRHLVAAPELVTTAARPARTATTTGREPTTAASKETR